MTCNTILHIFSIESKLISCVDILERNVEGNDLIVGFFTNVEIIELFTQKICISIKFFIDISVNLKLQQIALYEVEELFQEILCISTMSITMIIQRNILNPTFKL